MQSDRLPRFRRSTAVAPMQLTERDRQIIRLVHRHRFLRSPQIAVLTGGSLQHTLRRLQLLYHHGYLERPRAQIDYYHQGGSRHIVYGLGDKGAAVLGRHIGVPAPCTRSGEKNRAVGRVHLEHALLVSDIMVALDLACRKDGQVRLLAGEDLPLRGDPGLPRLPLGWNVAVNGNLNLGIAPDRAFALEYPGEADDRERAFFFLEADRGTMPAIRCNLAQTSFYRKLLAYEATWSHSLHRTRFGFHRFRVLTVTETAERVKSLVGACSQLNRGHGLFLFADRTALSNPNLLFSPIWQTVRPNQMVSLLNEPPPYLAGSSKP